MCGPVRGASENDVAQGYVIGVHNSEEARAALLLVGTAWIIPVDDLLAILSLHSWTHAPMYNGTKHRTQQLRRKTLSNWIASEQVIVDTSRAGARTGVQPCTHCSALPSIVALPSPMIAQCVQCCNTTVYQSWTVSPYLHMHGARF